MGEFTDTHARCFRIELDCGWYQGDELGIVMMMNKGTIRLNYDNNCYDCNLGRRSAKTKYYLLCILYVVYRIESRELWLYQPFEFGGSCCVIKGDKRERCGVDLDVVALPAIL